MRQALGIVLIGRNEGARLVRALAATEGGGRVVYVDSGSTDGSVAAARAAGAEVVELDMSVPFTAARARNAGAAQLAHPEPPEIVQFIDGDCALEAGWIEAGLARLAEEPRLGLVTGWRAEIFPDASIYNALCDLEWHRPAGPIRACGGDMMVRWAAFEEIGGLNPTLIAGEDEEFCLRLAKAGWMLERLPLPMTRHDAAMTRFGQWWQRARRAGHAFAQIGEMHPEHFRAERRRVWLYGALLPALALLGALISGLLVGLVVLAYLLSYAKTVRGLHAEGMTGGKAYRLAGLLSLSKIPNMIGMLTYFKRKRQGAAMELIEYK